MGEIGCGGGGDGRRRRSMMILVMKRDWEVGNDFGDSGW